MILGLGSNGTVLQNFAEHGATTLWSKNEGIIAVPRVESKQVFFEYLVIFYNCEGLYFAKCLSQNKLYNFC
jgi:hypothetical protein